MTRRFLEPGISYFATIVLAGSKDFLPEESHE